MAKHLKNKKRKRKQKDIVEIDKFDVTLHKAMTVSLKNAEYIVWGIKQPNA